MLFGRAPTSALRLSAEVLRACTRRILFTASAGVHKKRATFTPGAKSTPTSTAPCKGHSAQSTCGCRPWLGANCIISQRVFPPGLAFCVSFTTGPSRTALFDFRKTRRLQSLFGSDFGIDFSHPDHRKPLPANFQIQRIANKPVGVSDVTITPGDTAKCTDCHKLVKPVPAGGRELSIEKGHSTCFQCHGMRPDTGALANFPYMNDCRDCHEIGAPKGSNLRDIAEFKHADHEYDIRPRRKVEYRVNARRTSCAPMP